jgi:hypothetical protein
MTQCFTGSGNMEHVLYDTVLYWEREYETCAIRHGALLGAGI